jgi:DNA anti-recombination protein RmuC
MSENENVVYEKIANVGARIDRVEESMDKINQRMDEFDKKTGALEHELSNRLTKMETKFDFFLDITSNKLDNLDKKMDKFMIDANQTKVQTPPPSQADTFKEWGFKKGMQILDTAIYGGVLYAIAKGLKLF